MSLIEYRTSIPITGLDGATWRVLTGDYDDGVLADVWILVDLPGEPTRRLALERDDAERLMVALSSALSATPNDAEKLLADLSSALSATRVYAHEVPEETKPSEKEHK